MGDVSVNDMALFYGWPWDFGQFGRSGRMETFTVIITHISMYCICIRPGNALCIGSVAFVTNEIHEYPIIVFLPSLIMYYPLRVVARTDSLYYPVHI